MVCVFVHEPTDDRCGDKAEQTERKHMSTQVYFTAPTQAEVDRYIAKAHEMRSEYISQLVTSGFARLWDLLPKNRDLDRSSV